MTRLVLFILTFIVPGISFADKATLPPNPKGAPGPYTANPLDFISDVYRFGLALGGLLAFAMIIYGAVQYTVAAGNSSVQSDAKDRITQALIGLVLLLSVVLILNTISPAILLTKLPTMEEIASVAEPIPAPPKCSNLAGVAANNRPPVPYPKTNDPNLTELIGCIERRAAEQNINLGSKFTYDISHPTCNYTRGFPLCDNKCSHGINSCHYGGLTGRGGALAVDFGMGTGAGDTWGAATDKTMRVIIEGCNPGAFVMYHDGHLHVSHSSCVGN